MPKFFFYIGIAFLQSRRLIIISSYHIVPHVLEYWKWELIGLYIEVFSIQETHELLTLRSIWDMNTWCLMNTGEHPSMESHSNSRIEKWKYIKCLFDSFGNIIGSSCHDFFDEETIILLDIPFGRKYEKYWLISLTHEKIIYLWKCSLCSLEKSSTHRYPNSFFDSCKRLDSLVLIEKYNIIHNNTWNLERL